MATELEKALKRAKVSIKSIALAATPARGYLPKSRPWRVTLSRDVGEDKPLRLTLVVLSKDEPTAKNIIRWLIDDIEAGDLNLWEFAQTFNNGTTDESTEALHNTCKRVHRRVNRFFGELWGKVASKADL